MKALEILRKLLKNKYKKQPLWFGVQEGIEKIENIHEAIEELEEIQSNINTSIEEIEYALAKPDYANVYLNNALRFLKGEQK